MRPSLDLLLASLVFLQVLVAPTPPRVRAQEHGDPPSDEEPPGYREAIDEALAEYQARHYPEARALFLEAHAKWPTARTARALGMSAFELRDYPECITYLEKALASTVRPLDPALREKTEALLDRAYRLVARVHVSLLPHTAQATVDDRPVVLSAREPLVLAPGEHELSFTAAGHVAETRALQVHGGEQERWRIVLAPQGAATAPTPREVAAQAERGAPQVAAPVRASRERRPVYKSPWLWSGVGAAVVASAVAVVVGVTASRDPRVRTDPPVPTEFTPEDAQVEVR